MNYSFIPKIVKASGVKEGEMVLIHFWGEDGDKEIANRFLSAVTVLGATPVLLQQARSINFAMFGKATQTCFNEKYFDMFSKFDAVLDVFTYQPIILGYKLPPEQMIFYRNYIAQLFSSLTKSKRFTQIRIPTKANAEESGLTSADYMNRMENAYNIDYDSLYARCEQKIKELEKCDYFVLCTGDRCELHLDLEGRRWHIDAGDGDWPCGEVYIAPNESKTHGTIYFKQLVIEDVGVFRDITFFVDGGIIIESSDNEVNKYIQSQPLENITICEFGLGMNPNITDLCGYTVLDEKMENSFHIAIGANDMFGGQNKASRHTDFVSSGYFDLKPIEKGDIDE